jgi:hypothetical protein
MKSVSEEAKKKGTKLHDDLYNYVTTRDKSLLKELHVRNFSEWLIYREKEGWQVYSAEEPYCSWYDPKDPELKEQFLFAGTPDLVLVSNPYGTPKKIMVVDYKTGVWQKYYELQLALYGELVMYGQEGLNNNLEIDYQIDYVGINFNAEGAIKIYHEFDKSRMTRAAYGLIKLYEWMPEEMRAKIWLNK